MLASELGRLLLCLPDLEASLWYLILCLCCWSLFSSPVKKRSTKPCLALLQSGQLYQVFPQCVIILLPSLPPSLKPRYHYLALTSLKLAQAVPKFMAVHLLQPPECWEYRYGPPRPSRSSVLMLKTGLWIMENFTECTQNSSLSHILAHTVHSFSWVLKHHNDRPLSPPGAIQISWFISGFKLGMGLFLN